MEKSYIKLGKISIYDTGLIRKSSYVAGIFKKNNIETLDELFRLDDELSIDYGKNTVTNNYDNYHYMRAQIRGIIKLLRYKYLNESLFVDTMYGNKYNLDLGISQHFNTFLNETNEGKKINEDFKNLGFSDKEINILCFNAYELKGKNFQFDEAFLEIYENITEYLKEYKQSMFANKSEQSIFLEKINLIANYIKENNIVDSKENIQSEINIKDLFDEEKKLLIELNELCERSSEITNRISEIQKSLQGNKNLR